MGIRSRLTDLAHGDDLTLFRCLYSLRQGCGKGVLRDVLTFLMCRNAHRHGGYIGPDAVFMEFPSLPHGLHGVFISRYAVIGKQCRIYQNVTIGEVNGRAPVIGDNCLIGAGAVIIGGVHIGSGVKIGAGAVVTADVPDGCTVVSQPPRIIGGDHGP